MMSLVLALVGFLGDVLANALGNVFADVSVNLIVDAWDKQVLKNDHVKKALQDAFAKAVSHVFAEFEGNEFFGRLPSKDRQLIVARRSMLLEKEVIERIFPLSADWTKDVSQADLRSLFTQDRKQVIKKLVEALQDPYLEGLHPAFLRYLNERLLDVFVAEFISFIKGDEKVRSAVFLSFMVGIDKAQSKLDERLGEVYLRLDVLTRIDQNQTETLKLVREIFKSQVVTQDIITLVNQHTRLYLQSLRPIRLVAQEHNLQRQIQNDLETWIRSSITGFAVVVGEAGIGKTHLLANLVDVFLSDTSFAVLFFRAEDFIGQDFDEAIVNAIGLRRKSLNFDDVMRNLAEENSRRILLFLDTLDLVAFNHGPTRLRSLLLTLRKYNALLVGASRPQEYDEFSELVDKKFSLAPLSDDEVLELLAKFNLPDVAEQSVVHSRRLIDLCKNPLHARMLVDTFKTLSDVPTNLRLQELYNRYWLQKVAGLREGARPPQGVSRAKLCHAKENLAEQIALLAYEEHSLALMDREVKAKLLPDVIYDHAYSDLLDEGVLRLQGEKIEFMHQTLWEYAVAKALIKKNRVEVALKDLWRALNRGVVLQLGLQSRELKRASVFDLIARQLKDAPFLSKVILVDILLAIDPLSSAESDLLASLAREDYRLVDHILGLIIYEGGRHSFTKLFGLMQEFCDDPRWEIRRRLTEALPNLVNADHEQAAQLMEILRTDYDERWKTDVRRRVVEALPFLSKFSLAKALEISKYKPDDEVFTIIAIVEFICGLSPDIEPSPSKLLEELYPQLKGEIVAVLRFLQELLSTIQEKPELAIQMINARLNDPEMLIRICIARSAPRLLDSLPLEVLGVLQHCARPEEHKYVRRPVAKGTRELVAFMRSSRDMVAWEKARNIFRTLAVDRDELIRQTICDNMDDLIEIEPFTVRDIVVKYLVRDDNSFVQTRAVKLIMRLINFFPEQRSELLLLVDAAR